MKFQSLYYITQASPTINEGNSVPSKPPSNQQTTQATNSDNPAQQPSEATPQSGYLQLLFPILLIGVLYFLLIRPQQKKEKERQKLLKALKKGDKIITRGGLLGIITGLKNDEGICVVKIADKVNVEVSTNAIETVNPDTKKTTKK